MRIKNIENHTLVYGNFLDYKPVHTIDLVCTDLPYYEGKIPMPEFWTYIDKYLSENGTVVLFGQGVFYAELVLSRKEWFAEEIVWDKVLVTGFLNAKYKHLRQHENIAIFQKYPKRATYNPQFFEGEPLHGKGKKYKNSPIKNQNYGEFHATEDNRKGSTEKYPRSIVSIQKPHPSKSIFKHEKPVELLEYLIKTYSNEGDVVADLTMGSNPCGLAAYNLGRQYLGIEINLETYKLAISRYI